MITYVDWKAKIIKFLASRPTEVIGTSFSALLDLLGSAIDFNVLSAENIKDSSFDYRARIVDTLDWDGKVEETLGEKFDLIFEQLISDWNGIPKEVIQEDFAAMLERITPEWRGISKEVIQEDFAAMLERITPEWRGISKEVIQERTSFLFGTWFPQWDASSGKRYDEKIRANFGTKVHTWIEQYVKNHCEEINIGLGATIPGIEAPSQEILKEIIDLGVYLVTLTWAARSNEAIQERIDSKDLLSLLGIFPAIIIQTILLSGIETGIPSMRFDVQWGKWVPMYMNELVERTSESFLNASPKEFEYTLIKL